MIDAAEAAMRRFDGETALAEFDKAGDKAGRVRALWLLRRWDEARAHLHDLEDNDFPTWFARGIVALGQPDCPVQMIALVGSAHRDGQAAVEAFTKAAELDERAKPWLATALRVSGRADEAEYTPRTGPMLVEQALAAVEVDDFGTALAALDEAIALDPDDLRARILRSSALRKSGQPAKALAETERFMRGCARPSAPMREYHGWALYEMGKDRYPEALEQFRLSLETGPATPGPVTGSALVAEAEGDRALALRRVEEGLEHNPDSPELRRYRASFRATTPEDRVAEGREVLAIDPRDLGARLDLSYALLDLDRPAQARPIVEELVRELSGNRDVLRLGAWFDHYLGRFERALGAFRTLNAIQHDESSVIGEMRALRILNAVDQAEELYLRATEGRTPTVELRYEYLFCALHERRYRHAHERANAMLEEHSDDATALYVRQLAKGRMRSREFDDKVTEYAKAERPCGIVPDEARDRVHGQLRLLRWRLARIRAWDEVRGRMIVMITVASLEMLALFVSPWLLAPALGHSGLRWWQGVLLAGFTATVALAPLSGFFDRWTVSRTHGVMGLLGVAGLVYLMWRRWHVTSAWELLVSGVVVASAALLLFAAAGRLDRRLLERRLEAARRRHPVAAMVGDLAELAGLLDEEHELVSLGARKQCVRLLEGIASAQERAIRGVVPDPEGDPDPWLYRHVPAWRAIGQGSTARWPRDALLEQELLHAASAVAAVTRSYQRGVMLPTPEEWVRLREHVATMAEAACLGQWSALPQARPEKIVKRFRARVLVSVQVVLVAAIGPAALLAYQLLPGSRPAAPDWLIWGLYLLWPVFFILPRLDSEVAARIFGDLPLFGGRKSAGSDGAGGRTRPGRE